MPRKDVRFNAKYAKNTANDRKDDKVQGEEIGNSTILSKHIADGSVTGEKLAPSTINPFHCNYHLSSTRSGWVRVAQLKNLSSVEFWVKTSVSGHHSMTKIVGNYTFMGGSPSVSFAMVSNAKYGNGFTDVRVLYKSTYDIVYFEMYLPQSTFIGVSQSSAFGATFDNYYNITLTDGSVPSGYAADQQTWGGYDSAIIMV